VATALESEYLPVVPGAPHPVVCRLVDRARGRWRHLKRTGADLTPLRGPGGRVTRVPSTDGVSDLGGVHW